MSATLTPFGKVMRQLLGEMDLANVRYGDFTSTHEALGVLVEEVGEVRDAIRGNNLLQVRHEAIQVAAVAFRLARVCEEAAESGIITEFQARSCGGSL